jgi:hypothetical protein
MLVIQSVPVFVNILRSPGIDSQPGGPVRQPYLSYRPAMTLQTGGIDSLESIPGLLKCLQIRAQLWWDNFLISWPLEGPQKAREPALIGVLPHLGLGGSGCMI